MQKVARDSARRPTCQTVVLTVEGAAPADAEVEVFVNISNDGWFGNSGAPGQHLNMARMRAIENRRFFKLQRNLLHELTQ